MHRCAEIVPIHILTPRLQLPVEEVKCRLQNQAFLERSRQSWTEGRDGVNEVTDGRSERILHVVRPLCTSRRKASAGYMQPAPTRTSGGRQDRVSGVTESQPVSDNSAGVLLPNSGSFCHNRHFTNLQQTGWLLSDH